MRSNLSVAQPLLLIAGIAASVVVVEPAPIDLLLIGLAAWWLIYERLKLPLSYVVLGLVYVGASVVSQVIAGVNGVPFDTAVVRDLGIETYLVATVILLAAIFRKYPERMSAFVNGLVLGAVLVSSLFVALKLVGRVPDIMFRDEHRVRVRGLFKDPNVLGPFLIFPILLLLFRNEVVRFPFARLAAIPCMLVLVLTYSRGAYVGFFAAIGLLILLVGLRERISYANAAIAMSALAAAVAVGAITWSTAGLPGVEIETARLSYQSYDDDRFSTLFTAFDYVVEHPLGNGVRSFAADHGSNPHNLLLGKATDAGILAGLIVVIVPLFAAARVLQKSTSRHSRFSLIVGAALVGNMVVSSVVYSHHWRHMFFLVALAFALTQSSESRRSTSDEGPHIDLTTEALATRRRAEMIGQRS